MSSHRFVTYNILASKLANPRSYPTYDPQTLDKEARWELLVPKLEEEVAQGSILALQEVCMFYSGRLHAFFCEQDYHFVNVHYGNWRNNYMGVGIAFPRSKYALLDAKLERISDTMRDWPRTDLPLSTKMNQNLKSWVDWFGLSGLFKTLALYPPKPPTNPWDESKRRYNQIVMCKLQARSEDGEGLVGEPFYVATYHMPCAFWSPPVMTIHTALASQFVQRVAKNTPAVLMGDFNFKPSSGQYELMLKGQIDEDGHASDYPQGHDSWTPSLHYAWRSAYSEWITYSSPPSEEEVKQFEEDSTADQNPRASLYEPDFTNYAEGFGNPVFIDTLDYIFISGEWEVEDVIQLPHRAEITSPMPNTTEPSDHVKIGAVLKLP
jgi:mRNA deadenylase 3'-5' endonuclease subunit Ccr4